MTKKRKIADTNGGKLVRAQGKDLLQVLWSGADVLSGRMNANEYKTYLLGLVFYKYLSD
jgi:type I restriction enzyme M protein